MAEFPIDFFSELDDQIQSFTNCAESTSFYPEDNRDKINKRIDFLKVETLEIVNVNQESLAFLKKLLNKVEILLDNDSAVDAIARFKFSFVDLHANFYEIKLDLKDQLKYYKYKIKKFICSHEVEDQKILVEENISEVEFILSSNFIKEFANFEFEGIELFQDEDRENLRNNIFLLISKKSDEINPVLDLNVKKSYLGYYIITEILDFIKSDYKLSPKVTINGAAYSPQARSEAITKNFTRQSKVSRKGKMIESLKKQFLDLINHNKVQG